VLIGGIPAITEKKFRYVMRWSDHRTWGTDLPPVDDDLVYVPPGMHLLVDQTTPILEGIIVENGTIEFSNERDMVVSAEFITLRGGEFIAGTEEDDYDYKLTFVMYGNYYSPQQPMFGNKGIGCLECKFSMIGKKRSPTWTMIDATIKKGDSSFTVIEDVDWQVGEHIVVASTSYDHNEAEEMIITAISSRTITVDKPFVYGHYAGVEKYGASDVLEMRA
jgi:cell migration-inducing and hyaluronan-binding protein